MSRLATLIAELEGMSREYGAPPTGELWERDAPPVGLVGRSGTTPLRKELGLDAPGDSEKKPDAAKPDEPAEPEKEKNRAAIQRERLEKLSAFAVNVLHQLRLNTGKVKAIRIPNTVNSKGDPGSAVAMWDDGHTTLVSVFLGENDKGQAHAMKIEKKEGLLKQELDLSDVGIDRSVRAVASFVQGL